jgi:hypothetical protein
MSTPISATITRATVRPTAGMVMSRSIRGLKGRQGFTQARLHVTHGDLERVDLGQVQPKQEAMVRVTRPCNATTISG